MQKRLRKRKTAMGHPPSSPVRRKLQTDTPLTSHREDVRGGHDTRRDRGGGGATTTSGGRRYGLEADAQLLLEHLAEDEEFT